jgi:hypothetical protein
MIKLAHIINPVYAPIGSELYTIQPITYESMKRAKDFATESDIELYAVGYEEDRAVVPSYFALLEDLKRSVLDFGAFIRKKKLPLIADILQKLYDHTDREWLIYTNADICLMPQFYDAVASLILQNHDAILINRRRISKQYNDLSQLPLMYAEIGGPHPGYDCFVFHRSLLERFILDHICVGVPFVEVSLLHNIIAYAKTPRYIDDMHLTFHIGIEVMPPIDPEYYKYNRNIYETYIRPKLKPLLDIKSFPYAVQPWYIRTVKWILNPCISTAMVLELEGKSFSRKAKMLLDEIRWHILSR